MFSINLDVLLMLSCGNIVKLYFLFQLFETADAGDVCSSRQWPTKGLNQLIQHISVSLPLRSLFLLIHPWPSCQCGACLPSPCRRAVLSEGTPPAPWAPVNTVITIISTIQIHHCHEHWYDLNHNKCFVKTALAFFSYN